MSTFDHHSNVVRVPRLPGSSLADFMFGLGVGANRDVQRELASANEEIDHRLSAEELDDYARALERAQRKLGVRELKLSEGEF